MKINKMPKITALSNDSVLGPFLYFSLNHQDFSMDRSSHINFSVSLTASALLVVLVISSLFLKCTVILISFQVSFQETSLLGYFCQQSTGGQDRYERKENYPKTGGQVEKVIDFVVIPITP